MGELFLLQADVDGDDGSGGDEQVDDVGLGWEDGGGGRRRRTRGQREGVCDGGQISVDDEDVLGGDQNEAVVRRGSVNSANIKTSQHLAAAWRKDNQAAFVRGQNNDIFVAFLTAARLSPLLLFRGVGYA